MRHLIFLALLPLASIAVVGTAPPAAAGAWSFPDDDPGRLHLRDVFDLSGRRIPSSPRTAGT
ncbi:MAG: hypothetical protein AAFX50_03740 [Acidobacteriota bacterium]